MTLRALARRPDRPVPPHLPRRRARAARALLKERPCPTPRSRAGSSSSASSPLTVAMARPFGAWLFAVYEGRRPRFLALARPGRARRSTGPAASIRPRSRAGAAMRWRCCCSTSSASSYSMRLAAAAGRAAAQSPGLSGVPAPVAFNTAVSFVTNTNWQSYGGETTMSNLDPDGRARGPQFRLGRDRHRHRLRADPRLRAARERRRSAISGPI